MKSARQVKIPSGSKKQASAGRSRPVPTSKPDEPATPSPYAAEAEIDEDTNVFSSAYPTTPLTGDGMGDGSSAPGVAGLPRAKTAPTPEEAARAWAARRRMLMWLGLVLLVAILVMEVAALSPWTDPVASVPPRQVVPVPLAEVDPFGVNVFLHKEVDHWKKERTLDMARDMGAKWIKQQFPWAEIQFSQDPDYTRRYWDIKNDQSAWDKFDDVVDLAEQRGLRIIARIDSTPPWARYDDTMPQATQDDLRGNAKAPPSPGHLEDFGGFIKDFASRYRGRVAAIQVWNEPNLREEWPTGVNAHEYVQLLTKAYLAAKSEDPNMIVLAAPLAINNERLELAGNLNELDYLQAMYYAGARPYFDAMSATAYGKEFPPEDPPSRERLNFRRVELLRKVMEDNGDYTKAVWFNEYGWNASPEGCCVAQREGGEPYPWGRVSLREQAEYTVRGIKYAQENWPWAGVFTIWYLRQVGDIPPNSSEYYFGLLNPEFVAGPAYQSVQSEAASEQVATPGEWGALSSRVEAGPGWEIRLGPSVPGGTYLAPSPYAVDNGAELSVLFRGTDVRLMLVPPAVTSPTASRYYVTVDGGSSQVASNLPRDDQGQAYIDIPADGQATEVQVVRGLGAELGTGQHRLTVSVDRTESDEQTQVGAGVASPTLQAEAPSLPGIATVSVEANRSYLLFILMTGLLVAGIVVEIWALRQSRAQPASRAVKGAGALGK